MALRRRDPVSFTDDVLVHALLRGCQLAAHDLRELGRQMLGVQPVHASDDEVVAQVGELLLARLAEFFLLVRRVRFSSPEDGSFIILRELVLRAEDCVGREA